MEPTGQSSCTDPLPSHQGQPMQPPGASLQGLYIEHLAGSVSVHPAVKPHKLSSSIHTNAIAKKDLERSINSTLDTVLQLRTGLPLPTKQSADCRPLARTALGLIPKVNALAASKVGMHQKQSKKPGLLGLSLVSKFTGMAASSCA